ncbi:hypothetical protein EWM64_g973 [Hericium alpestre]|uniref:Uncharacterized protein n=1 Tax=Hericium alpestre TaxID=135208 RepID=A0A4Z0A9R0_9AGAM|nr:hypothetical protein EWM64_g973 [Hericium alpestre]
MHFQFHPLQINEQTGEPYIRLPEPHANIVLTPPRPSDVPFTVQILNDVRVYRFLSGPPYPYRLEDAESWLKSIKAETDAVWKDLQDAARDDPDGRGPVKIVNGSPVRTIREQREDGTEVYLGDAEFRRHDFADVVHPEERARLKAENDAKEAGDPSIIWTIGVTISDTFLALCILLAKQHSQGPTTSPTEIEFSDLSLLDSYESSDSSGPPRYAVSTAEATFYYSGISPSPPQLVFRTSKQPWVKPTGPEAYRHLKQLRPVYGHQLNDLWDTIGPQVVDLLDQQKILFSSVDVVRFSSGTNEDVVISPVVLWIGVIPDSLGGEDAFKSANTLLNLLGSHGIHDVDVEYRESVYRRSTGPELYAPVSSLDATKNVIDPLTTSLNLPISNVRAPQCQGTLGFYFSEGGESKDILAVTARHVLFPRDEDNSDYTRTSTSKPRKDVLLMGTKAWHDYLRSVLVEIGSLGITAEIHEGSIEKLKPKAEGTAVVAKKAKKDLKETEELLRKTREAIDELEELYVTTKREWSKPSRRIIGHAVRSPPISVDTPPHGFAKDVVIIKLDKDRFKSVEGPMNVLDLGPEIDGAKFTRMMYPRVDTKPEFKYPSDRLLPLGDIISEELLRRPDMLDINNEACLFVTKRGLTTKTTIGRATGIFSYVREYFPTETTQTSKEWAILPYDSESGAFSKGGDSGSVIVDRLGRFGGLLTGGAGKTPSSDVTYAMPFFWLWPLVKTMYPNAHLYPVIE